MRVRSYTPADKAACLAIFDSNTPPFFTPDERDEFIQFLDEETDSYFVVELNGNIVACGGYIHPRTPVAIVAWTMVSRTAQRQGVGRLLLDTILERVRQEPGVQIVKLQTSQYTYGFFERLGFKTERIVEHGFGANLHQYGMGLALAAEAYGPQVR